MGSMAVNHSLVMASSPMRDRKCMDRPVFEPPVYSKVNPPLSVLSMTSCGCYTSVEAELTRTKSNPPSFNMPAALANIDLTVSSRPC